MAIERHFADDPETPAASIYFEHPLDGNVAIEQYELYLRYYIHGLRFAGFPHAFHAVGSALAVRSDAYLRQGGMNCRQAGEDFYFVQKLMPLGGFSEIVETTVYPSARVSHRTPFGTGKTLGKLGERGLLSEAPQVFADLKPFIEGVDAMWSPGDGLEARLNELSQPLADFLRQNGFSDKLVEIRRHTASSGAFRKRFFHWFNAFRILKYAHYATDTSYPKVPVGKAAAQMLEWRGFDKCPPETDLELLQRYREIDKQKTPFCHSRESGNPGRRS